MVQIDFYPLVADSNDSIAPTAKAVRNSPEIHRPFIRNRI
jgi:hypothetical protein